MRALWEPRGARPRGAATIAEGDDDVSGSSSESVDEGLSRAQRLAARRAKCREKKALDLAADLDIFGSLLEASALRHQSTRQKYRDALGAFHKHYQDRRRAALRTRVGRSAKRAAPFVRESSS